LAISRSGYPVRAVSQDRAGATAAICEIRKVELRAVLRQGGWIAGVLVAERPMPSEPDVSDCIPFLLLDWRRSYTNSATWRGGVRSWRDFDHLLCFLHKELGCYGTVRLHEPDFHRLQQQAEICRALGLDPLRPRWWPGLPESKAELPTNGNAGDAAPKGDGMA
jgi:hypothetical protein